MVSFSTAALFFYKENWTGRVPLSHVTMHYAMNIGSAAELAGGLLALSSFLLTAITFVLIFLFERGGCCIVAAHGVVVLCLQLVLLPLLYNHVFLLSCS